MDTCYKCKERNESCHTRCETYLNYKKELEHLKDIIRQEKDKARITFRGPK